MFRFAQHDTCAERQEFWYMSGRTEGKISVHRREFAAKKCVPDTGSFLPFQDRRKKAVARVYTGKRSQKGAVNKGIHVWPGQFAFIAQPFQLQTRVANSKAAALLQRFIDNIAVFFPLE